MGQRRTAFVLLLGAAALPAYARESFEGIWARTEAECRDDEGPNSRTLIDLHDPKVGPLFDQYENHCRVTNVARQVGSYSLRLTCHEFWEEFTKRQRPRHITVRVAPQGPQRILIDGARHVRCIR